MFTDKGKLLNKRVLSYESPLKTLENTGTVCIITPATLRYLVQSSYHVM